MPKIEYPGFPTVAADKKNKVAGYGPIASHWAPRIFHAGTIEDNPNTKISSARPPDFNPTYYQTAPEDQLLSEVHGEESVILYHLHPKYSEIHSCLPTIDINFETLIENKTVKRPGKLQSIIITPDKLKLQMVWQANFSNNIKPKEIKGTQITHRIHKL